MIYRTEQNDYAFPIIVCDFIDDWWEESIDRYLNFHGGKRQFEQPWDLWFVCWSCNRSCKRITAQWAEQMYELVNPNNNKTSLKSYCDECLDKKIKDKQSEILIDDILYDWMDDARE